MGFLLLFHLFIFSEGSLIYYSSMLVLFYVVVVISVVFSCEVNNNHIIFSELSTSEQVMCTNYWP